MTIFIFFLNAGVLLEGDFPPWVSLCKIFERLKFNSLFNYFMQNKLFTEYQWDFIPGYLCVAQLLSITHEMYKRFDFDPLVDMRGTFLYISKAFDK